MVPFFSCGPNANFIVPSEANDTSKRPKLEPTRLRHGSSSSTATPGGNGSSGSERLQGSEPPPSRQERVNSIASIAESQQSSTTPTLASQSNSAEDSMSSPRPGHLETSPREPHRRHARRPSSWRESGSGRGESHQHLPSLSDMLDDGRMGMPVSTASEGNPYSSGFVATNQPRSVPEPPNVLPAAPPRMPLLRHDQSSTGSIGSVSPATSFARTPGEGPLPIHALLSNHPAAAPVGMVNAAFDHGSPPSFTGGATPSPTEPPRIPFGHLAGHRGYGT